MSNNLLETRHAAHGAERGGWGALPWTLVAHLDFYRRDPGLGDEQLDLAGFERERRSNLVKSYRMGQIWSNLVEWVKSGPILSNRAAAAAARAPSPWERAAGKYPHVR